MHVDDEFVLENPFEGLSGLLAFGDRSSEIPKKIRLIAPNVSNMESFASPSEDVKGETWFQKFFLWLFHRRVELNVGISASNEYPEIIK